MMTTTLKLAPGLALPLEAVSRTFGILAVRGAGKSNTAAVMAEEMFAAGLPFVVVDPVGSWYGLRSSADGSSAGLPIPIFGGKHGDVPLERGAGELLADLVVEKRLTCVLDLSRFESEGDKKAFLLAFARRLYLKNENPLHLFLEEADDYIPQKPMRDEAQLLRAWENIVRRGRSRGLGMTLITQRSAAVNKMVLTQVETLFAMRTTGPQDIAAIEAWVKYHQAGAEVLSTLASLEDGEAWVWSPHFLRTMARHQIRRRRTFDSGATPANVRARDTRPPATLADIDISALQERMAATLEKAKADDPRELRKQLAEKDRRIKQLESATSAFSNSPEKAKPEARPVLTDTDRVHLQELAHGLERVATTLHQDLEAGSQRMRALLDQCLAQAAAATTKAEAALRVELERPRIGRVLEKLSQITPPTTTATTHPRSPLAGRVAPALAQATSRRPARQVSHVESDALGNTGLRRMLTALAQRNGLSVRQMALRVGMSGTSGSFRTYLSKGRSQGWIVGTRDRLEITEAGITALGSYDPLPEGEALRAYWLNELGNTGAAAMLRALCGAYPAALSYEALGAATGMSPSSGSFRTYLSRLRTLELIHGRGEVRASEELFS